MLVTTEAVTDHPFQPIPGHREAHLALANDQSEARVVQLVGGGVQTTALALLPKASVAQNLIKLCLVGETLVPGEAHLGLA